MPIVPRDSNPQPASKDVVPGSQRLSRTYPFYIRATIVLLGLFLFFNILMLLDDILIPLCFGLMIAILLNPLVNRLMKLRVPKAIAILLSLLLAMCILGGIAIFISAQISHFGTMAPEFKARFGQIMHSSQQWIQDTFNLPIARQQAMIQDALRSSQTYIGQTLGTLFSLIGIIVLLPIYIFLFLYYKLLFLNFFYEVFEDKHEKNVADILNETKNAVQSYIQGLLIEASIIAVLNSTALLILGVPYAIVLGVIGAVLNIVPYIGGLVAIALPVLISFLTGDGGLTTPVLIIGSYAVIQFIDNNIIVPRIVSSKVDVNAFVTILIVLLGGTLWGFAGMFLSVPFIAICKIIFDRVDGLKPWGKVLGAKIPKMHTFRRGRSKRANKIREKEVGPDAEKGLPL